MFLWSAVFIWWGSASWKNNLEICVGHLSVSFRKLRVQWSCDVAELQPKLLLVSQPNSYSVSPSSRFPIINSWVSILLQNTRTQGLVHGFSTRRDGRAGRAPQGGEKECWMVMPRVALLLREKQVSLSKASHLSSWGDYTFTPRWMHLF